MSRAATIVKAGIRRVGATLAHAAGVPLALLRGRVVVLTYHRVVSDAELRAQVIEPGMYVHVESFARQMRFLAEHFTVLPLGEALYRWAEGDFDPVRRYAVVTFDDGWRDNLLHAWPVLRAHGIPATVFVCTDLVGTSRWFWPDRLLYLLREAHGRLPAADLRVALEGLASGEAAHGDPEALIASLKRLPAADIESRLQAFQRATGVSSPTYRVLLDWSEIETMAAQGVSFGSHGASHQILTLCDDAELERELCGSFETLRSRGFEPLPVLAYPNGGYDERVVRATRDAGYRAALTTDPGRERLADVDPFRIRRTGVHDDVTREVPLFALRLWGHPSAMRGRA